MLLPIFDPPQHPYPQPIRLHKIDGGGPRWQVEKLED